MSEPERHVLPPAGDIPNSPLPLLVWRNVLPKDAKAITARFARHGWTNAWTDGVFGYHHFHSNAHEALGVARGEGRILFGGPDGAVVALRAGDLVVIPAGVGHKRNWSSPGFVVVGAYPGGADYDIRRGVPSERQEVASNLAKVSRPKGDPHTGATLPGWTPLTTG